jgi:hypothetical protein
MIQITLHNSSPDKRPVSLKSPWALVAALLCNGVSIVLALLLRGAILSVTPEIFAQTFDGVSNWTDVTYPGSTSVRGLALGQWALFASGLAMIVLLVVVNYTELTNSGSRSSK